MRIPAVNAEATRAVNRLARRLNLVPFTCSFLPSRAAVDSWWPLPPVSPPRLRDVPAVQNARFLPRASGGSADVMTVRAGRHNRMSRAAHLSPRYGLPHLRLSARERAATPSRAP